MTYEWSTAENDVKIEDERRLAKFVTQTVESKNCRI